jgi:hypothetical protein
METVVGHEGDSSAFHLSRDGAISSYGQGSMTKKKENLVGANRLNFYFLPYIF